MSPYSKMAQTAISAISILAEAYGKGGTSKFNSAEIAKLRGLPKPVIAKVLTILSQAGLVKGSPGPGGGYALARPPENITLFEVISLFDRVDRNVSCPFGPDYCGVGPHCPLHEQLLNLREEMTRFLHSTTLAAFVPSASGTETQRQKRTKTGKRIGH
ncbi:MAG: Rrf2 family transcriptional regulator [Planctomycetota bacterium]